MTAEEMALATAEAVLDISLASMAIGASEEQTDAALELAEDMALALLQDEADDA
ncbi:hypothetical protein [Nocardia thailandica]|uniref:hypothetical protein n=1 Tax=Nocardia thailandica TaxID=257275 RepID=UPI0002F15CB6|nr:hypothetical protein [Nocardia thailandica]